MKETSRVEEVEVWGTPPPPKHRGAKPRYAPKLEVVKARYVSGDHSTWGLISAFDTQNSAGTSASYLRRQHPDFEYQTSESPTEEGRWVVWARWKGETNE